jgi:hypothetical protein
MPIIHECSPECSHDDPLAGVEIASDFDLTDFEAELHTCDSGCSHDPMADVKVAEKYDLGDFAAPASEATHTYAGAEANSGRIEVVASVPDTSLAADSVTVTGVSQELAGGVAATATVVATEIAATEKGWSKGEAAQSAAETRVERGVIEESKRASVTMPVSSEIEATRGFGASGYGVAERGGVGASAATSEPFISRSGNFGEIAVAQFTANEISKQVATRSEVSAAVQIAPYPNTSTFERIQRGEISSVSTTNNYQGATAGADRQAQVTREVNDTRAASGGEWQPGAGQQRVQGRGMQEELRALSAGAAVASQRFLGWASEKASLDSTARQPLSADKAIKAEQRIARFEPAERLPSSVRGSTASSRVESKVERFMGWAAERVQSRGEANLNQPAVGRNGDPVASQQAAVSSQRLDPRTPREVANVTVRDVGAKEPSQPDARVVTRLDSRQERVPTERSVDRDLPDTAREFRAQSSTRFDSRQTSNHALTNESAIPSPVPGMRPGRVDRKQTSDTVVYSERELSTRESARGLRKAERLISRRLKDTVDKLSERLSKLQARRSGATVAAQVSQLALHQLALMNKMLEILDEANEGREERGEYSRIREPRRLKVRRLERNRNRIAKKKKAKKLGGAPLDNATQKAPTSLPVSAGAVLPAASVSSTGLAGAHNSGPSKSLDIFQAKADDDQPDQLEHIWDSETIS